MRLVVTPTRAEKEGESEKSLNHLFLTPNSEGCKKVCLWRPSNSWDERRRRHLIESKKRREKLAKWKWRTCLRGKKEFIFGVEKKIWRISHLIIKGERHLYSLNEHKMRRAKKIFTGRQNSRDSHEINWRAQLFERFFMFYLIYLLC